MAIYVDFVSVKGEDPLSHPRWRGPGHPGLRSAGFLVTLACKVANGSGNRFKYANTLPQVLFPYTASSSASLDLRHRASEEPHRMTGGLGLVAPAHSFREQE